MPMTMGYSDIDRLVDILAKQAGRHFDGPRVFFVDLVDRAHLPERWTLKLAGVWKGDPYIDARKLFQWAIAKGINPQDRRFTTLGAILRALLPDLGVAEASTVVAIIFVYGLYRDPKQLNNLRMAYRIPQAASMAADGLPDVGPDIDWWATDDEVELQRYLKPEPNLQDVGFLMRVVARAASVCRIEIPSAKRQATGFLIAPTLVLTNFHVLNDPDVLDEDPKQNAKDAVLYFGNITTGSGAETEGQDFKLDASAPIVASSPVKKLDYALLQVEGRIGKAKGVKEAPCDYVQVPRKGIGLHMLGHPEGKPMQFAHSNSGVTAVKEERGLIQYWTRAAGGSSGSPCFNDAWKVVALHHAERSKLVGSRREGILIKSIYADLPDEIKQRLAQESG